MQPGAAGLCLGASLPPEARGREGTHREDRTAVQGRQRCPARRLREEGRARLSAEPSRPIYAHGAAIYRPVALAQADTHAENPSLSGQGTGPAAAGESPTGKAQSRHAFPSFPGRQGHPCGDPARGPRRGHFHSRQRAHASSPARPPPVRAAGRRHLQEPRQRSSMSRRGGVSPAGGLWGSFSWVCFNSKNDSGCGSVSPWGEFSKTCRRKGARAWSAKHVHSYSHRGAPLPTPRRTPGSPLGTRTTATHKERKTGRTAGWELAQRRGRGDRPISNGFAHTGHRQEASRPPPRGSASSPVEPV